MNINDLLLDTGAGAGNVHNGLSVASVTRPPEEVKAFSDALTSMGISTSTRVTFLNLESGLVSKQNQAYVDAMS